MVFQQQSWESPAFSTYCILNRVRLGSRMTWTSEYIQPGTKTCRKSFSKYLVPHTMSPEVASSHDPAINLDITISSSYCHHIECHNPQHKGWSLKFVNFTGDSSLYLWKEQEFKKVEEVWPTLFFIFRGGHTSSTFLNSCSFQRYRPLSPVH